MKTVKVSETLPLFINTFNGRLPEDVLTDMLDYCEFNEFEVAFDMLIDKLDVNNVNIHPAEWDEIVKFSNYFNYSASVYNFLKRLIVRS